MGSSGFLKYARTYCPNGGIAFAPISQPEAPLIAGIWFRAATAALGRNVGSCG
jgi:hypothetical protein